MTKKRNTVVWEGWCSIEIPAEWTWSQEGSLINIFDEQKGVSV